MATQAMASRPHASRFHVTVCSSPSLHTAAQDQQHPQTGATQEDESGFEVSILNSLPWNRANSESEACLANCLASADAASCSEENSAGRAEDPTDTLTAGHAEGGSTLTAKVAKSMSQLRLSASNSSANFRSLECNCCAASASCSCCRQQSASAAQDTNDFLLLEGCVAEGDQRSSGAQIFHTEEPHTEEPQHLELPWSQKSSSWSKRTCSRRSQCSRDGTCTSTASWHQLAVEHRSERVNIRCSVARPKTFAHSLSHDDCQSQKAYQAYLSHLQDRVQLWLSQTEHAEPLDDSWEDGDAEMASSADCERTPSGATFFLGSQDQ